MLIPSPPPSNYIQALPHSPFCFFINHETIHLFHKSTTHFFTLSEKLLDDDDDQLCSETAQFPIENYEEQQSCCLGSPGISPISIPNGHLSGESRIERAWAHWKKLGEPKLIVAPMVDNSELPFRLLCRKYGAEAAYTPMLHSCIFTENEKYRSQEFTTCKEDRPLFVQFCANDPDTLLEAAQRVAPYCDYVDINLGCPQRIARRGNYGAFLMNNLPLVKSLVEKLALNLTVPVSCKIRVFPDLQDTLNYAKKMEKEFEPTGMPLGLLKMLSGSLSLPTGMYDIWMMSIAVWKRQVLMEYFQRNPSLKTLLSLPDFGRLSGYWELNIAMKMEN